MTSSPETVFEQSDAVLSGGMIAVRGIAVPADDETRGAVAVTVRVPASHFQLVEADGSATATLLLSPAEALGASAWLRHASQAADQVGPPLYEWNDASKDNPPSQNGA